jgi:plasmid stabilization system protein ParE
MYELEYLPIARHDMVEIVKYISHVLYNPSAAENLADEMIQAAEKLTDTPFVHPVYRIYNRACNPLKHEYRKLKVKNYIMFYYVDDKEKKVVVARVIYSRRDYEKLL